MATFAFAQSEPREMTPWGELQSWGPANEASIWLYITIIIHGCPYPWVRVDTLGEVGGVTCKCQLKKYTIDITRQSHVWRLIWTAPQPQGTNVITSLWLSLWISCYIASVFFLNLFIEVSSTYKKLHIFNVYDLMSLNMSLYPWNYHHNQCHKCIHHL